MEKDVIIWLICIEVAMSEEFKAAWEKSRIQLEEAREWVAAYRHEKAVEQYDGDPEGLAEFRRFQKYSREYDRKRDSI